MVLATEFSAVKEIPRVTDVVALCWGSDSPCVACCWYVAPDLLLFYFYFFLFSFSPLVFLLR